MKYSTILLTVLFCVSCQTNAHKKLPESNRYTDTTKDLYYVDPDDTSMNAAINKAKLSLNKFDSALKSNNQELTSFAVKKRYPVAGGGGEHIWVAGLTIVNGGYKGFINNDVEQAQNVKYGDTVFVSRNEITDWMYLDHSILRGGYTIRESRNNLSPADKVKMDKDLGFKIED